MRTLRTIERALLVAVLVACVAWCAWGCGPSQPLVLTGALLDVAMPLYAATLAEQGEPVDVTGIAAYKDVIMALLAGGVFQMQPVVATPENQIISPLTGKPCPFFTTQGPTAAGYAVLVLASAVLRDVRGVRVGAVHPSGCEGYADTLAGAR